MGLFKKGNVIHEPHRINVSLGRKYNVGNYESVDLHVSLSVDVEPNETDDSAFETTFDKVRAELNKEAKRLGIAAQM
jgi:hypothetical protein